MTGRHSIELQANGVARHAEVEPRTLLVHFLRDELQLIGTHLGCDTGNCGRAASSSRPSP